jgi:hypothetical protein
VAAQEKPRTKRGLVAVLRSNPEKQRFEFLVVSAGCSRRDSDDLDSEAAAKVFKCVMRDL